MPDVYWFDIEVIGPVADDHVEALGERLTGAGGIDATVQAWRPGRDGDVLPRGLRRRAGDRFRD